MKRKRTYIDICFITLMMMVTSCSTVSILEPDEQLYIGMEPIEWTNYESSKHQDATQAEVEAAVSIAPNGALFGSPYYRTPFPYGLWIWNYCYGSSGVILKWLNKSFGKQPVLMQNVNVPLRASVASSVLANNGYFHGNVTYDIIEGKMTRTKKDTVLRARTAKVKYHVNFGPIFTIDTISYSNFPTEAMKYISNTESLLESGKPFSVSKLENERVRIYNLFRDKGYYFFQKGYLTYLADTLKTPGKVNLQIHLADSLDDDAMRRWVIGSTTLQLRRTMFDQLTDTIHRKYLYMQFGGKKPPVRARILLQQLRMRPGSIFSQEAYQQSMNNLTSQGIYSSVDIAFTKRLNPDGTTKLINDSIPPLNGESRAGAGVLDMTVSAVLDKPYSISFGAKATAKSNDRLGPGVDLTLTKRNAFRGGESLSITAGANYEFQLTGEGASGNSYDFSLGATLEFPRLLLPSYNKWRRKYPWYTTPSTTITASAEKQRRAGFFTRNVFSTEYTYIWQPSRTSVNKFMPLGLTFGSTVDRTDAFEEKIKQSATSQIANKDEFTPKMRYTYSYSSPTGHRFPFYLEASVTEAGNLINLGYMAFNHKWSDKGKKILGCTFSQYLKFEADVRKSWQLGSNTTAVFHFYGGYLRPLGNDSEGPYSEQMFVGGANDLRGFAMRSIGPGNVHFSDNNMQYIYHNGDLKFVTNFEYRPRLFGSLYGALFFDAGNVWCINHARRAYFKQLGMESAKVDIGIDVGVGLRYDLDYFVIRLDWGFAVHKPYNYYYDGNKLLQDSSGFFNVKTFKDMSCINFAIGYPF